MRRLKKRTYRLFTLIILAMMMVSAAGPVYAQAIEQTGDDAQKKLVTSTASTDNNYLTDAQYTSLGFTLNDPEAFSPEDTSNPLENFEPVIQNELYWGQMNNNDDLDDYCGTFSVLNNVASTADLGISKMMNNTIGGTQNYYDKRNDENFETQCKNVVALKPGKLSDEDATLRKDIIIENTLYNQVRKGAKVDYSHQMIMAYTIDDNNQYHAGTKVIKQLDEDNWVGDIETSQQAGFISMTVGDFDGDDYNEVAVYSPTNGGGTIYIYQPKESNGSYELAEEATIKISDIDGRFKFSDDVLRTVVDLKTYKKADGSEDLVANVSLPYDNTDGACGAGAIAIYSWKNSKPTSVFKDSLTYNNNSYRYKFNSAVSADLNGDGTQELIVTGAKNYGYTDRDSKGDIDTDNILINILNWNGSQYSWAKSEPQTIRANTLICRNNSLNQPLVNAAFWTTASHASQAIFCDGSIYRFTVGKDKESFTDGLFTSIKSEDFQFDDQGKPNEIYSDSYIRNSMQPYIQRAVVGSFTEDNKTTEQIIVANGYWIYENDLVTMSVSNFSLNGSGQMQQTYTDVQYIKKQDEDDNGTFLTFCALNVDNDSMYIKYKEKTVGWSKPNVYSVMLSTPYWNELNYGSLMASRGTTSYAINTSNTTSVADTGKATLTLGAGISAGVNIFGSGYEQSISGDVTAAYAHTFQTSRTTSQTLTFTGGGGVDNVALIATPVAHYYYDVYIPAHKATQADVDVGIADAVGAQVEAAYDTACADIQLDPAIATVPVSTYNTIATQYNSTAAADEQMGLINMDDIYLGRTVGDPTTYASNPGNISGRTEGDAGNIDSTAWNSIALNGATTTSVSLGDTTSHTTSDGYTVDAKLTFKETFDLGAKFLFFEAGGKGSFTQTIGDGLGTTWTTGDSTGQTYTGSFVNLPDSAQTGTNSAGLPVSSYAYSTKMHKWEQDLSGVSSKDVAMENGKVLTNKVGVIGYTVSAFDYPPAALPEDLHVDGVTSSSILLGWTTPDSNITRMPEAYRLYYSLSENGEYQPVLKDGQSVVIDAEKTNYLVTGLKPNTSYYFKLESYKDTQAVNTEQKSVLGAPATGTTKGSGPIITGAPQNIYTTAGDQQAGFTITASPSDSTHSLSYQWQELKTAVYGAGWKNIQGQTSTTLNPAYYTDEGAVTKEMDGNRYRCVVTEHDGNSYTSVNSRSAILYVDSTKIETQLTLNAAPNQKGVSMDENGGLLITAEDKTAININAVLTAGGETSDNLNQGAGSPLANQEVTLLLKPNFDAEAITITGVTDADGVFSKTLDLSTLGSYTLYGAYGGTDTYRSVLADSIDILAAQVYKIHYVLKDASYAPADNTANPTMYITQTGKIFFNSPNRNGAEFTGWYTDPELTQKIDSINTAEHLGDLTLYAGWKLTEYSITYQNAEPGQNPTSYTVADSFTLKPAVKDGYTFTGWFKDSACTEQVDTVGQGNTGNLVFYAGFKENADPSPEQPGGNGQNGGGSHTGSTQTPSNSTVAGTTRVPATTITQKNVTTGVATPVVGMMLLSGLIGLSGVVLLKNRKRRQS